MNKKQGDQMQFSLERRLEKRKWIHPTHHTSLWIVIDSSILLDFFHLSQNDYHATEKTAELS